MTLSSMTTRATAGEMAPGKMWVSTYTTTVDTYAVIDTFAVACNPGIHDTLTVATNNLLFKFEYTRDGVNWLTVIEDYPVAAAATAYLTAVRNAIMYRVSVKPAVAGNHGSVTWILVNNQTIIPPEYRAAFAYESATVTNAAAVSLTSTTYNGAMTANITVEDNPIRVRWDGTAPLTTEGHLLQSGDTLKLDFTADIYHFKAIATGGNAKIRVTYSR